MADLAPLIDIDWLAGNIDRADVKLLDATWSMTGEEDPLPGQYIKGAQFFDIDEVADLASDMKHMLPSASVLETAMSKMGIHNDDHIIVYDRHGFRAAPRVWWTLRMFGHARVSILNGGLPAWKNAGYKVYGPRSASAPSQYKAKPPLAKVVSFNDVVQSLGKAQILDARSTGRFHGTEPEPRAGLRSGHVPDSFSLPFGSIRTPDIMLKPLPELAQLVGQSGIDVSKPIITSCGSGITAAGLAFVLHCLGATDVSVYDGSWTEYGASDAPVETT